MLRVMRSRAGSVLGGQKMAEEKKRGREWETVPRSEQTGSFMGLPSLPDLLSPKFLRASPSPLVALSTPRWWLTSPSPGPLWAP